MKSKKYRKIEADNRSRKNSATLKKKKTTKVILPPETETDKIIDEMLLNGCYVSDIFERFGLEFQEE